jgi:hypothetical protein
VINTSAWITEALVIIAAAFVVIITVIKAIELLKGDE